jgi:endonuclease/exonuclease/phosphatase family metal-dependent hydrolase
VAEEVDTGNTQLRRLRVVTYNVHACIGNDGEFSPQRICDVLHELKADFIGIQELEDLVLGDESVSEYLARNLDMHAYRGPTLMREDAHYGNLLLSRKPAQTTRMHDISVPGREPRGIIEAEYDLFHRRVRLMVTHFGLRASERRGQVDTLSTIADNGTADVDVLLGDFNEWRPASYTARALKKRFGAISRRRTWPARWPVLALDSICVSPEAVSRTIRAQISTTARVASDHLPLVGDLELPG